MKRLEIFDRTRSTPTRERARKEGRRDDASLMALAGRLEGRVIKEGPLSLIEVEHTIGKDHMHGNVRLGDIEGVEKTPLAVLFPSVSDPEGCRWRDQASPVFSHEPPVGTALSEKGERAARRR